MTSQQGERSSAGGRATARDRTWLLVAAAMALALAACGAEGSPSADPGRGTGGEEPAGGEGSEVSLRYSSILGGESDQAQQIAWWVDRVNEHTTGTHLELEEFYAGAVASAGEELNAVQTGTVDAALVPVALYPAEFPLSQIVGMPFVTEDAEADARAFAELYETDELYRAEWDRQGVRVVTWYMTQTPAVACTAPVTSLSDMEGRRTRFFGLSGEALAQLGADVTAIDLPELFESLERGVIDCASGLPMSLMVDFGLHEVAPHFANLQTGTYAISGMVAVRDEVWESLPQELQDAMLTAGEEVLAEAARIHSEQDARACETLREADVEMTVVADGEVEQWREKVFDGLLGSWLDASTGAGVPGAGARDFAESYIDLVERYEWQGDYQDGLRTCAGDT